MASITCTKCQTEVDYTPGEDPGACPNCNTQLDPFADARVRNAGTARKLATDRAKANRSVLRSYRIKP